MGCPRGGLVTKNFKKLLPAMPLRPLCGDTSYKQLSHDLGVLVYRFTSLPENMKEFTIFIETWREPVGVEFLYCLMLKVSHHYQKIIILPTRQKQFF